MTTYNFIYLDKEGNWNQVEINSNSKKEAWFQFLSLDLDFTYIDML